MADWRNQLYFGDNLGMLRKHIADGSIDLIYLDPPFNSKANYNVLFGEKSGERSAAQITAFEDTWHWGIESENAYHEVVIEGKGPKQLGDLLQALRTFLGQNDMMAYLVMMAVRLVELRRVLKPTGSIYLHCDPTASHYLKLVMDAVFGLRNFRAEITWKRHGSHNDARRNYAAVHDTILFYGCSDEVVFNRLHTEHDPEYLNQAYRHFDSGGKRYRVQNLASPSPRPNLTYPYTALNGATYEPHPNGWKVTRERMRELDEQGRLHYPSKPTGRLSVKNYLDEMPGPPLTDVWTDIAALSGSYVERLHYQTQKPETLLERIIKASSNEGDLVLDPFCGCGTTVAVAERLRRRWIGIDITYLAVNLMKRRLADTFGSELSSYQVIGDPKDLASAEALALENRHQFEWWAVDLVGARPAQDKKKGADTGIDGYLNFFDDDSGQAKTVVVQVKSGHVTASQIRDLKGVMEREKATMGAFLTLSTPTKPMMQEAASAGFYEPEQWPGHRFPRLQIFTIGELLAGKKLEYPSWGAPATYKQATRKGKGGAEQQRLSGV